MPGQERAGILHREKLMLLVGRAPGRQRGLLAAIKADGVRAEFRPLLLALHIAPAFQVQAQFHAIGVKAGRPIQFAAGEKIMPFNAVTRAVKTAEQRVASPRPRPARHRLP